MLPQSSSDQRQFLRIRFDADVQLQVHDQVQQVHLLDIALKGALVQTDGTLTLAQHDPCRLTLRLADDGQGLTMTGRIVHLEGMQVGIACQDIDVLSLTRLRRLLELNSGSPELMDRELARLFTKAASA